MATGAEYKEAIEEYRQGAYRKMVDRMVEAAKEIETALDAPKNSKLSRIQGHIDSALSSLRDAAEQLAVADTFDDIIEAAGEETAT